MQSGTWIIVLAAGDGDGAGHPDTTPALLRDLLFRATALAPRSRIHAVVTQKLRRKLEETLWFLLRSNVLAQPDNIGTAYGILLILLRISQSDPDACIVLLPLMRRAHDEESFLDSLEEAVAYTDRMPEQVVRISVELDATGTDIVVGRAGALLELYEPEIVDVMREIVERAPDTRVDPIATTGLLKQLSLPYRDFHQDVLPGERHDFGQRILPLRATGSI